MILSAIGWVLLFASIRMSQGWVLMSIGLPMGLGFGIAAFALKPTHSASA